MKNTTKYIIAAITMEVIAAMITQLAVFRKFEMEVALMLAPFLIPIFIIAYFLGQKFRFKRSEKWKTILLSISLIFALLYLFILLVCLFHIINSFQNIIDILAILIFFTTMFGGIQTLLIGLWLGHKIHQTE